MIEKNCYKKIWKKSVLVVPPFMSMYDIWNKYNEKIENNENIFALPTLMYYNNQKHPYREHEILDGFMGFMPIKKCYPFALLFFENQFRGKQARNYLKSVGWSVGNLVRNDEIATEKHLF